ENGYAPVMLDARRREELDAGSRHPFVDSVEVIDTHKEADPASNLVSNSRYLALSVRARDQNASLGTGRANDDPPFRSPVVGLRRGVFDQLESQDINEEHDG